MSLKLLCAEILLRTRPQSKPSNDDLFHNQVAI